MVYIYRLIEYPFYLTYILISRISGHDFTLFKPVLYNTVELCIPSNLSPIGCERKFQTITFDELCRGSVFVNFLFFGFSVHYLIKGHIRVSKHHPQNRFAKQHTIESFIEEQKQNYPHLQLFAHFNPQKVDQMSGQIMGMKTSREFAVENGLIRGQTQRKVKYINSGNSINKNASADIVPVIDRYKLITLLKKQLGGLWYGLDYIDDAEAILLARYLPIACCTNPEMHDSEFNRIKNEAAQLEEAFWYRATEDILTNPDFAPTGVDIDGRNIYPEKNRSLKAFDIDYLKEYYIKPYINSDISRKYLDKHAYTKTFIIAIIFEARKLGVAAPCQMRWLKFYNRQAWSLLSNIGRPSFFCESMGPISHYQAESVSKKIIFQPHFDVAIRGYEYQLQSYHYDESDIIRMKENKSLKIIEDSVFNNMNDKGLVSNLKTDSSMIDESNVCI